MFYKLSNICIDDVPSEMNCSLVKNYIVSSGTKNKKPISLSGPTTVNGIAFILCTQGTSEARINAETVKVKRQTLLTLLPGCVCESIGRSDDYSFEYIFFSIDFMYELNIPFNLNLLRIINRSPLVNLTKEQFDCLLDFHAFIVKNYKKESHLYREQLAKNLLSSFMTEICNVYNNLVKPGTNICGRKVGSCRLFFELLLEHIKRERTVQFYADKLCVTPKYLSQMVKEITGKTIMDWINDITMVVIKAMLKTSEMSISQISDELHFPNPSFFCRYFKKHTGITPLNYREN